MFSLGLWGRRRGGGKKKARKTPKATWFDELTVDQLKQLCKASKLVISGTKADLVNRLLQDDFCSHYGGNKKSRLPGYRQMEAGDFSGMFGNIVTMDSLKEQCRTRLLQVGGNKFDLVLRIVQHEKGTGGATLKRAAVEMQTVDGVQQPVAKKRKKSKPSPATMYNRVQKKIEACEQKKYQSHWGSKSHAPDVCSLMNELLRNLEPYVESDPQLVCEGYHAVVSSFVDNFDSFSRPGYCEDLEGMADKIARNVESMRPHLSTESLHKLAQMMREWKEVGDPYGLLMDYDMEETVRRFKEGNKKKSPLSPAETAVTEASNDESGEE